MSQLERINPSEFSPVAHDEAEMVLGGLAAVAGDYTSSGTETIIVDGQIKDVKEYKTGDPAQ
jgi:hypothetical protein